MLSVECWLVSGQISADVPGGGEVGPRPRVSLGGLPLHGPASEISQSSVVRTRGSTAATVWWGGDSGWYSTMSVWSCAWCWDVTTLRGQAVTTWRRGTLYRYDRHSVVAEKWKETQDLLCAIWSNDLKTNNKLEKYHNFHRQIYQWKMVCKYFNPSILHF